MIIHHTQPFDADIRKTCQVKIILIDIPLNYSKKEKSTAGCSALDSALSISTTPLRLFFAFLFCVVLFSLLNIWTDVFSIDDTILGYCRNAIAVIVICILLKIDCTAPLSYIWNTILVWASGYFSWVMTTVIFTISPSGIIEQHYISVGAVVFLISLLFVLTGRLRLSAILSSTFWLLLTIANFFVYSFRGELLFAADLLSIGTALDVSKGYSYQVSGNIILGLIIFTTLVALASLMSWKIKKPLISFRVRIVIGILCIVTSIWFFNNDTIGEYYYSWTPQNNDYIYAFVNNIKMLNISKPEGYSIEQVASTLEGQSQKENTNNSSQKPVVIAIMNETFSDPSVVGDFTTDKSYISFFDSLNENTIKGNVYTEVFGAGTCDSEYAFISGNTTAYTPPNARPYQLYLTEIDPNLTTILNDQGYTSHAMHPGTTAAWNRNNAYYYLGFNDFQSVGSFTSGTEMTRGMYVSDLTTYKKIISMYENRGNELPFYFDVTIANHAGYDVMTSDLDPVHITDVESSYPKAEVYLSLMRRSDQELQELISYFNNESTPVIICFFGDHQANIETGFYEEIAGKPMSEWTDEELQRRYCTPFFIWANYDIPEQTDVNIGIYNLSSLLLQTAGLEMSSFNQYLLQTSKTLPVISTKGIIDNKGNYYNFNNPKQYANLLTQFQYVNYNNLFDKRNRLNQYYFLPDSQYLDEKNKIKKRNEPYYINGEEIK